MAELRGKSYVVWLALGYGVGWLLGYSQGWRRGERWGELRGMVRESQLARR